MKISKTIPSLKQSTKQWQLDGQRIAFVPTMGHLHAGHIVLINQARLLCDKVVVSIFVNPLQFNEKSDFDGYPKTLDADQKKLITAQTDLLFLPDSEMMYANGQLATTKICVPEITQELEGEHRPGHFDGVSTVVNKLFNLVQPDIAFFGEKDFQQLLLIRKMVEDLNMPVEIQSVATCREADGLAMSSRNSRLSDEQRGLAPKLYAALQQVSRQVLQGEQALSELEVQAKNELQSYGFEVEYISVRDRLNLKISDKKSTNRLVLAAARLGEVRLIDNLIID
ncbi:MAG: pantoate--beta-alanine ligase [endosymbiont of Galathealinum brachiosum]|uniref:Pantothenate synthetase n=1 Tax=endosymbiont of Galathealinum brachiosum TaxID=2200906 RepID=A0A370D9I1_9GAMM|nr:MAG: pantoate--beta-alanine ligase [endosymbiont of Galathealinum brachiosum]